MEEFGCREGPHEGVDPHRHDEENYCHGAFVELPVGQYPCCRITEQNADCGGFYRHFQRQGECAYGVSILEEFGEVSECEVAGTVLKGVYHDQDQRQGHKQHKEYGVRQSP